jgi:Tfp pilus assembly protein PilF/MinD-like ATPase involved in chromosome partitioning or flagellar assembly
MLDDFTQAKAAFVTFYSFKGGVGRSMALINVAGILAGRGFRVLALDLDLEAPGISYLMQEEANQGAEGRPGFVDLLADACSRGPEGDLFALDPADVVERYSYHYTIPEAIRQSDEGLLRIMPAGRLDAGYQARLDALALGQLYRDGHGQPLIAAFKQVLQEARRFDFVFVDSRTGFSDESGICTRDLADCLMVIMGLNRQNVEGTATFLRAVRDAHVAKPIRVALSPVPNGEDELVERREKEAALALSRAYGQAVDLSLQIPYHPRLAVTEEPHIFRRSRGYLYDAYAGIENAVLAMVGYAFSTILQAIETAAKDKRIDVVMQQLKILRKVERRSNVLEYLVARQLADLCLQENAAELRRFLAGSLPANSWAVGHLAHSLSEKNLLDAELFYQRALEVERKDANILGNYAGFLWNVRGDHNGAEVLYRKALEVDSEHANNLGSYANLLWNVRGDHDGAEALYKKGLEIDPKHVPILGSYALFLSRVRGDHDSAEVLYKKGLEIDPKHADILGNYALFLWRDRGDQAGAEALYKKALEVNPRHAGNIGSYAVFLTDVGRDYEGADAFYKQALEVDPRNANNLANHAKLLYIWGRAEDAAARLTTALAQNPSEKALLCELYFYAYAHAWQRWPNSLAELKRLLQAGASSEGWPLQENVRMATRQGHPDPPFLAALARVVSGDASVETLDAFPAWQSA